MILPSLRYLTAKMKLTRHLWGAPGPISKSQVRAMKRCMTLDGISSSYLLNFETCFISQWSPKNWGLGLVFLVCTDSFLPSFRFMNPFCFKISTSKSFFYASIRFIEFGILSYPSAITNTTKSFFPNPGIPSALILSWFSMTPAKVDLSSLSSSLYIVMHTANIGPRPATRHYSMRLPSKVS